MNGQVSALVEHLFDIDVTKFQALIESSWFRLKWFVGTR